MRIQHNIPAMNAYRNYNNNTKALSGNLEKLSSGYKINRAGDDAAGLAISEKMRAQITGLDAAQKNVKDGVSLVKTAEGAMQEIQDMLKRMKYLATESANGTYQDEVDRDNIQKEVESLRAEINRIADSANFNGIKLLDGTMSADGQVADPSKTTPDAGADGTGAADTEANIAALAANNNDLMAAAEGADGKKKLEATYATTGSAIATSTIKDGSASTAAPEKAKIDLSFTATTGGAASSANIGAITVQLSDGSRAILKINNSQHNGTRRRNHQRKPGQKQNGLQHPAHGENEPGVFSKQLSP